MRNFLRLRAWASPLTIASFAVVAVTGFLMFFHWDVGSMKPVHEWLGLALVAGGLAHLVVNWRPLVRHFRRPIGLGIIAIVCVAGALWMIPRGGRPHGPSLGSVVAALEQSPLALVAQVAQCSPQSAVETLRSQGIQVENETQKIAEIAADNGRRSTEILAYVTQNAGNADRNPLGH